MMLTRRSVTVGSAASPPPLARARTPEALAAPAPPPQGPRPPRAARPSWTGSRSRSTPCTDLRHAASPRPPSRSAPPCSASSRSPCTAQRSRSAHLGSQLGVGRRGPGGARRAAALLPAQADGAPGGARQVVGRDRPRARPQQGRPHRRRQPPATTCGAAQGDGYRRHPDIHYNKPATAPYWQPRRRPAGHARRLARLAPEPGRPARADRGSVHRSGRPRGPTTTRRSGRWAASARPCGRRPRRRRRCSTTPPTPP